MTLRYVLLELRERVDALEEELDKPAYDRRVELHATRLRSTCERVIELTRLREVGLIS